jgi:hypothetical protein
MKMDTVLHLESLINYVVLWHRHAQDLIGPAIGARVRPWRSACLIFHVQPPDL